MEKAQVKVQILIPLYNAVELIDDTMQSIWNQNFDSNNIYIVAMDFGSTDGTYEKLLSYDSFHLGIYQCDKDITPYCMVSETAKIAGFTFPGGEFCYYMVLMPGDVIYPNYLSKMAQIMYRYREYNVSVVMSEVDIKKENGSVIHRANLYETERVIDGKKEYMEYVLKGYQHNILCFGGMLAVGNNRTYSEMNERIWWNKSRIINFERNAIYIPERLGCIKERYYEDELQEILLRWESLILFRRSYEAKFGRKLEEGVLVTPESNLAYYAVWRSFLMAEKEKAEQSKSCFLIAGAIYPDIKSAQIYKWMEKLVLLHDDNCYDLIKNFFLRDNRA